MEHKYDIGKDMVAEGVHLRTGSLHSRPSSKRNRVPHVAHVINGMPFPFSWLCFFAEHLHMVASSSAVPRCVQ